MSSGRCADVQTVCGPSKTLYDRFIRWAARSIWLGNFHTVATSGRPPAKVLPDSAYAKAHCCEAGGKGGAEPGDRALKRWRHMPSG